MEGSSEGSQMEVLRLKGVVDAKGCERRVILQAVHQLFDKVETTLWSDDDEEDGGLRRTRVVVIGRHLDRARLVESFHSFCCQKK